MLDAVSSIAKGRSNLQRLPLQKQDRPPTLLGKDKTSRNTTANNHQRSRSPARCIPSRMQRRHHHRRSDKQRSRSPARCILSRMQRRHTHRNSVNPRPNRRDDPRNHQNRNNTCHWLFALGHKETPPTSRKTHGCQTPTDPPRTSSYRPTPCRSFPHLPPRTHTRRGMGHRWKLGRPGPQGCLDPLR